MSRMSKEVALKLTNSMSSQKDEQGNSQSDIEYARTIIKKINNETETEDKAKSSEATVFEKLMAEIAKGNKTTLNTGAELEAFFQGESQQVETPNNVQIAGVGRSLAPLCVIAGGVLLGNIIVIGAGVGMALANKIADKHLRGAQTLKALKVHEMNDKYMDLDPETRKMFPSNKGFQIDKDGNMVLLAKRKMTYEHANPKTKNIERWIFLEPHNGNPEQIIRCTIQQKGFFRTKSSVKFDVFEANHEKTLLEDFSKSFEALEEMSP